MSWKEVRKNAKDSDGKADLDDAIEENGAEGELPLISLFSFPFVQVGGTADTNAPFIEQNMSKPKKRIIKLSWDIVTIYSDVLKNRSGHHSDDEDEDETEAHEDSVKRLKVLLLFLI